MTDWTVETNSSAVTSTDDKTANLADDKFFKILDSTGSGTMWKVLNDASDFYSMQLFGHTDQPAKFYITSDQGEDVSDSWLWQVDEDGVMTWGLRTSGGNGLEVEDDTYTARMTLTTPGALTILSDLTVTGGDIYGPTGGDFSISSYGIMTFALDLDDNETNT